MPTSVVPLAAVLFGLLGDLPATAEVRVESLRTFGEPDDHAFPLDTLRRGGRVRVVDSDEDTGWLTIEPTAGSFGWVERSKLGETKGDQTSVVSGHAVVRAGIAGARLPGPPSSSLARGDLVQLLDRPALTLSARSWVAIAPVRGEVRYVRSEGVAWPVKGSEPDPAEIRTSFEDGPRSKPPIPHDLALEVARIESLHRSILSGPVESWRLEPVRTAYEALLKRVTDPATEETLNRRLAKVAGQSEIARSAKVIRTLLDRGKRRDREVTMVMRSLDALERPTRGQFVAEGRVQPSSRQVEGRRVFALIGKEGRPIAYLDVPPGLDTKPLTTKRVGVRGLARYNEALGNRLIAVRDLEALD